MEHYHVLILGGGIAAVSAAAAARRQNQNVRIALLSEERLPPYSRPLLARTHGQPMLVRKPEWYAEHRIDLFLQTQVLALETAAKRVHTSRGVFSYDACVYALGARAFVPAFDGGTLPGVCSLRTYEDLCAIRRAALRAEGAAVMGGGTIGLETAYRLAELGLSVTVLESGPHLLPQALDEKSAQFLRSKITRFAVRTGARVLGFTGQSVVLSDMEPVPAQLVVVSCGIRANVDVARAAGLMVGQGVLVNESMETSAEGVYACGDCAEQNGAFARGWTRASAQGVVAGTNASGGCECCKAPIGELLLHCPEFDLYRAGSVGQAADADRITQTVSGGNWEINERRHRGYGRDFFADGKLIGTVLIDDLTDMRRKYAEITGETP